MPGKSRSTSWGTVSGSSTALAADNDTWRPIRPRKVFAVSRKRSHRMVGNHMSWQSEEELIGNVNCRLRGWMNYFSYGTLWKTYHRLERFVQQRIRGWLVHKHRVGSRGECRYPVDYIYGTLGLVYLRKRRPTSRKPEEKPDPRAGCGKSARPVR